ncbi:hypothetical protein MMC18_004276 [Xylographa bjoerkii]|nr:hypothetical protein [Xylographa bjoerkii]
MLYLSKQIQIRFIQHQISRRDIYRLDTTSDREKAIEMHGFVAINKQVLDNAPQQEASNGQAINLLSAQPDLTEYPFLSLPTRTVPSLNAVGRICCAHEDCAHAPPAFSCKRHWFKHMEKHKRPYKCSAPGCESLKGFTSEGQLGRHHSQNHSKNGANSGPLFCPYIDCERSKRQPFNRKANWRNHISSVHRHEGTVVIGSGESVRANPAAAEPLQRSQMQQIQSQLPTPAAQQQQAQAEPLPSVGSIKRMCPVIEEASDDKKHQAGSCTNMDWKTDVKRLRQLLDSQEVELEELIVHKDRDFRNILVEKRALLEAYIEGKKMQAKSLNVKEAQIMILQAMLRTARDGGDESQA